MKKTQIILLSFLFCALPLICIADEIIQGNYCYTYGDKESLKEAKELAHTMAIRTAIESYRAFIISSSNVKDFALTNDIIQILSSGYLKNIKVLNQTVDGRTVCEKVEAIVSPQQIEKAIKQEVQKRTKTVEKRGIDNIRIYKNIKRGRA